MNRCLMLAATAAILLAAAPAFAADYAVLRVETVVDAPISKAWAVVGGWCTIEKWRPDIGPCVSNSGDGGVGSIRHLAGARNIVEVMVAQTRYSYTYTQPASTILYHGTLAAEPIDPGKTRLIYTLLYDQEPDGSQPAKEKDRATRTATWTSALVSMKTMIEGK